MSSFPSSPWPPPPPPPLLVPTSGGLIQPMAAAVPSSSSASHSFSPSLLIIAAILLFVFLACITIHLILRLFSSRSSSSSSRVFSSSSIDQFHFTPESESTEEENNIENNKPDALIDALPLFTLGSSLATLPKSSPDCAVCLSPFDLTSELRLLPACRHAFHSHCIDTWLRSTPSCPLCRASVRLPFPPLPCTDGSGHNRTESFRIEIGSISRRRTDENPRRTDENPISASGRSYSIGSFDYRIEDEIDAVVARITRVKEEKDAEMATPGAPPPPGDHIAELAGGDGRGWLRDYVDRLTSSASSSFNSLRFSGRWSARWSHRPEISTSAPDSRQWDVEAASLAEDGEAEAFYAVYRWIVGV